MTSRTDTERILDAFLAPEADRFPDRVMDATLDQLARTRQRRAQRVPWRFPTMQARTRATAIAAVVLVAVVVGGGLIYLNSPSRSGVGSPATTPTPTLTPGPTPAQVAPGIAAWKDYTSKQYGYHVSYPSDWNVYSPATRDWKATDGQGNADTWPYADVFGNPESVDGDSIGVWVWDSPARAGADLTSVAGLKAWAQGFCTAAPGMHDAGVSTCKASTQQATPMCLVVGTDTCRAAILVAHSGGPEAYFAEGIPDLVRVVSIGRPDGFAAAARYGGTVQLLKSLLTRMGVVTPQAGQVPGG